MDTKRILVLSDTHGDTRTLKTVLRWVQDKAQNGSAIDRPIIDRPIIDRAVFLGDGLRDLLTAEAATGCSFAWEAVRGNNDIPFTQPEAAVFDCNGHRFFLCHGHRYNVYHSYNTLIAAAKNVQASVALFGHTHVPFMANVNGILLINPGSIGMPRSNTGATFAILECSPAQSVRAEFWGIGAGGEMRKVTPYDK